MDPVSILYPSIAMFALTLGVLGRLGAARYRAIHRREVSIGYYRLYNEGQQPERLHVLGRHVQNHFEVPPLLHLGVVAALAAGAVTPFAIAFAWLFVALRVAHTFIHLGTNDVSRRFFCFGTSLLALAGLWISLLVALLTRGT